MLHKRWEASRGFELTDEQIDKLGQRGVRLDERSQGHGLGLAIAFEIMRLNRGSLTLSRSTMGGLLVALQMKAGTAQSQRSGTASAVDDKHDLERVGGHKDDASVLDDEK